MLLEDGDHRKLAGPWNQAEAEDVQNRILDNTNACELCSIDPASTRVAVTLTPTVPCVSVGGAGLSVEPPPHARSLPRTRSRKHAPSPLATAAAHTTRHGQHGSRLEQPKLGCPVCSSGPLLTQVRVAEERVGWLPPRRGSQRRQRGARLRGQLGTLQRLVRVRAKVEW